MIRGRFNGYGQAEVDASLLLPGVPRLGGEKHRFFIPLIIDTGADRTILVPDYEPYEYADFSSYPTDYPGGYGGLIAVRCVPVQIELENQDGRFDRLNRTIEIASPESVSPGLPSAMGRDVLDLYRLTIDKSVNLVSLERPLGPTP